MSASRFALVLGFVAAGLHMAAVNAIAQPVWTDKFSARGVTIDYLKPFLKDDSFSGSTSITFLSARIPVSKTLRLKPEIPIGYASSNVSSNSGAEVVLGNPYLGLEVLGEDATSTAEIGLRLPTIYSQTVMTQVAVATDFDRFESFAEETAAITGSFVGRNKNGGLQMEVAGGVTILVPFNDKDTDIYGQYAGQLVFRSAKIAFTTGISGRILFTEADLTFGERSTHQIGFAAQGIFGNFRPGVMGRLAIDKPLRNLINGVLGLNFSYELR